MSLTWMIASKTVSSKTINLIPVAILALSVLSVPSFGHADDMSQMIAQKTTQTMLPVPAARVSTSSSIRRAAPPSAATPTYSNITNYKANNSSLNSSSSNSYASNNSTLNPSNAISYTSNNSNLNPSNAISYTSNNSNLNSANPNSSNPNSYEPSSSKPSASRVITASAASSYRYPQVSVASPVVSSGWSNTSSSKITASAAITASAPSSYRYPQVSAAPAVLPAFLSGNYDNVDSEYLPLLSTAELQSSKAARGVISIARTMALNERTIIQGGCWDYLNAVFNRAGVSRNTLHKGTYREGPYANSSEIEIGDWLYYINHGYKGIEHSGLFVGWVDESAKQALMLSYAGENRREPARYRVYDLSNVYQIMRPII
ncbi:hypothetical protein [Psychrobacter sp. BF1]|uniref:hypothetical protein n=1 Tax=Psychrobacter sp. BF1 TaxID=2821147 RepID=UPI00211A676C|nr:hypothetical protein [Psychrobacter sp. BF1]